MNQNRTRYRATLKVEALKQSEFILAAIEYYVVTGPRQQEEAEYIAREYARMFYGAEVDSVTEMGAE